jgi:hypothetical protein
MPNHFHLVLETPHGDLVPGVKWLLSTCTNRFNRKHKLFGHLFCGRYKALPMDGSTTGYLNADLDYRCKRDLEKQKIAPRLRAETTMALSWMAQRLKMGAPGSLAICLRANPK